MKKIVTNNKKELTIDSIIIDSAKWNKDELIEEIILE
jgi:hypothetical protein